VLEPFLAQYPGLKYSYLIEIKYIKPQGKKKELAPEISINTGTESDAVGFSPTRSDFLRSGRFFLNAVGFSTQRSVFLRRGRIFYAAVGFFSTRSDFLRSGRFFYDAVGAESNAVDFSATRSVGNPTRSVLDKRAKFLANAPGFSTTRSVFIKCAGL